MRQPTKQRYWRIQQIYRKLAKAKLSHELCLEILKDFFNMKDSNTMDRILTKPEEELEEYPHSDLDEIWVDARLNKHFSQLINTKETIQE